MADPRYWIGLTLVDEVGPVISRHLVSTLGNPENVFRARISDLLPVQGMTEERADHIVNFQGWDSVDLILARMEREKIDAVGLDDDRYPAVLREMHDSPVVLYMKGEYMKEDRFGIAVVGSRKNSSYGELVTRKIAGKLASMGLTIISGFARGIDTLSHKAALSAGGRTIAVLGSGLDVCYPPENTGLMGNITRAGCLMSEFAPGTLPNRENFPRRNRLISGLSLGVVVVEAAAGSGSLITAKYALEQNREVFAIPGNITSAGSEGTNRLIQQGAKAVLDAEDVVAELAPLMKGFLKRETSDTISLTQEEKSVCSVLSGEPVHIDALARESGLHVQQILGVLLSLELKGIARQSSGKRFSLS